MAEKSRNLIFQEKRKVQELWVEKNFAKIACPSRLVISGPTMCGKSTFALKLIQHRKSVYDSDFDRIVYALPQSSIHLHQDFIQKLKNAFGTIEICEGLPDVEELYLTSDKNTHKLLILDDLMTKVFSSSKMLELITSTSHHCNISVVIICQSLFLPAKHRLTLIRNCSEKVLFHDKVDQNQLQILSRHIFPSHPNFLKECFNILFDITLKQDLRYLLIDASMLSQLPHNAIVRSNIFPETDNIVRPMFFFPTKCE